MHVTEHQVFGAFPHGHCELWNRLDDWRAAVFVEGSHRRERQIRTGFGLLEEEREARISEDGRVGPIGATVRIGCRTTFMF